MARTIQINKPITIIFTERSVNQTLNRSLKTDNKIVAKKKKKI